MGQNGGYLFSDFLVMFLRTPCIILRWLGWILIALETWCLNGIPSMLSSSKRYYEYTQGFRRGRVRL